MNNYEKLDWKKELKNNVTTVEELKQYFKISKTEEDELNEVIAKNPMNIPRYYLDLVDPDNPEDPIRKSAVPSKYKLFEGSLTGKTTEDHYRDLYDYIVMNQIHFRPEEPEVSILSS